MFRVTTNHTYIGTMTIHAAHIIASAMCVKLGDVVQATTSDDDDHHGYYLYDLPFVEHTWYHNGTEVIHCEEVSHYISYGEMSEPVEPIPARLRTMSHSGLLSTFKYNRSDMRCGWGSRGFVPSIKRQMRRAERRVGKALIKEDM